MPTVINNLVASLAGSPYFVVISGICSIISVITLGVIVKSLLPMRIKPEMPQKDAEAILDKLLHHIENDSDSLTIATFQSDDHAPLPNPNLRKVDANNSFEIVINKMIFCLIKTDKTIYLYAALSFYDQNFKCVSTSNENDKVNILLDALNSNRIIDSETIAKSIIAKLS